MTINELITKLQRWPSGCQIIFGCKELEFQKLKERGGNTVQLEFSQVVWKDKKTGEWHIDEKSPQRIKLKSSNGNTTI